MAMVQQNVHFSTQAQYPSLGFVTAQEIQNTTNNKRPLQQPALGVLTFLQSFVAGRANFCSHLLASLVHFTVVKSQAILSRAEALLPYGRF